jgi:hypothetical protein
MIFKTWDFNFGTYTMWVSKTQTWKFFGHDFQDVGSLVFGDLEFALRVSKTQKDLGNFRIWFSRHDFQDLGSQLWGLDFHTRGFQDRNLKMFRMWFSRCGISILAHDFQDMDGEPGDFTVSEGHGHPLVILKGTLVFNWMFFQGPFVGVKVLLFLNEWTSYSSLVALKYLWHLTQKCDKFQNIFNLTSYSMILLWNRKCASISLLFM